MELGKATSDQSLHYLHKMYNCFSKDCNYENYKTLLIKEMNLSKEARKKSPLGINGLI